MINSIQFILFKEKIFYTSTALNKNISLGLKILCGMIEAEEDS